MTDQYDLPEDLDRIFGPQEQEAEVQTELNPVRLLETRIAQLERQQQALEEAHQHIVAQNIEASDALLREQHTALARLEQEVAVRTKTWQERVAVLEQAKATSERERLAAQQRLLTFAYEVDAQVKAILEIVKGHEGLESIRSGVAALLRISDTYCNRDARGALGEDLCGNGGDGNDLNVADEAEGSSTDSGCPFDLDVALARAGGDTDLLKELATLFLTDGPKHLSEVKAALRRGDGPTLTRAAHTIKGAAGVFGAAAVTQAASELEKLGLVDDLGSAERGCVDLEAALTRLLDALTAFIGY